LPQRGARRLKDSLFVPSCGQKRVVFSRISLVWLVSLVWR
jgi:hypothetical protein